jgi:hypothetical protein
MQVTEIAAVVFTQVLLMCATKDSNGCCSDYTTSYRCVRWKQIFTKNVIYRPYSNILHSMFVQMWHEMIRRVCNGTEVGGNRFGPLEYQRSMTGGTRDGHNTPESGQQVPGWDLNQFLHKCKSCVTTVPTHYVSVARVYKSANGNECELFTGSEILVWFMLRHW